MSKNLRTKLLSVFVALIMAVTALVPVYAKPIEDTRQIFETESADLGPAISTEGLQGADFLESVQDENGAGYVPGQIIIVLKDAATEQEYDRKDFKELRKSLKNLNIKVIHDITKAKTPTERRQKTSEWKTKQFKKIFMVELKNKEQNIFEVIEILKQNPYIETAEPNYIAEPTAAATPNDPFYSQQWALQSINVMKAWEYNTGSPDVVIGVLDTGIDFTHPDLAANLWTNPGEIPDNGIDDDGNGYIDDIYGLNGNGIHQRDHGTLTSSVIAAAGNNNIGITGVAYNCKIADLKMMDNNAVSVITALNYCRAMGFPITNNSYSSGFSYSGDARKQAILDYGGLFVAGSGNEGVNGCVYPAAYDLDNVIAVGGHNENNQTIFNYHKTLVDIAAPASNVYSCTFNGGYRTASGTSLAAPQVSGAAALLKSYRPELTPVEIKDIIINSAKKVPGMENSNVAGGKLDIAEAFASLPKTTYFTNDFKDLPAQTLPSTPGFFGLPAPYHYWYNDSGAKHCSIDTYSSPWYKVLRLNNTSGVKIYRFTDDNSAIYDNSVTHYVYEWEMMIQSLNDGWSIAPFMSVKKETNGQIDGTDSYFAKLKPSQFYKIAVEVNKLTKTFDLYVDGIRVKCNVSFPAADSWHSFEITNQDSMLSDYMLMDNLKAYSGPYTDAIPTPAVPADAVWFNNHFNYTGRDYDVVPYWIPGGLGSFGWKGPYKQWYYDINQGAMGSLSIAQRDPGGDPYDYTFNMTKTGSSTEPKIFKVYRFTNDNVGPGKINTFGTFTYEMDIRVSGSYADNHLWDIGFNSAEEFFSVSSNATYDYAHYNKTQLPGFNQNGWYRVAIEVNQANNTYKVYLNGSLALTKSKPLSYIYYLNFKADNPNCYGTSTLSIDNMIAYPGAFRG